MKTHGFTRWFTLILITVVVGCNGQVPHPTSDEFDEYWYSGNAELNRYAIKQMRYGEMREGNAILIFVTEDFNTEQQVKQERKPGPESTTVLKLNAHQKFVTGIYDYSIMTSTFTPVDFKTYPHSLKVTNSVQDWCGQTFLQLNEHNGNYEYQLFSYFQSEGDQKNEIEQVWLEDELWNRIRISPQSLPMGNCEVIPAATFFRLNHQPIQAHKAVATMNLEVGDQQSSDEFFVYNLHYTELNRKVTIRFNSTFPYKIVDWRISIDGELNSSGILKNTVYEPYWKLNQTEHHHYRDSLGLDH